MDEISQEDLEHSLIRNYKNRYPELAAVGLNRPRLKTLILVWKSRGGDLAKLVESLTSANYSIENKISDDSGNPYTFEQIYSTLWRGEPVILNSQKAPLNLKKSLLSGRGIRLDLSEGELKTLKTISKFALSPVTYEMIATAVGIDEIELIEILHKLHENDFVEIYTEEGSRFIVIELSDRLVFDGEGCWWVE